MYAFMHIINNKPNKAAYGYIYVCARTRISAQILCVYTNTPELTDMPKYLTNQNIQLY